VQMWVDDRAEVDQAALQRSADVFDTVIHPAGRRYFGSEWDPGVDGDSRLVVLNGLFSGAAGYFYSVNQYPQEIHPHSNEHEMFVMNLRALSPGSVSYDAVLAHEFQHMILWHLDANEEAWVSEGCSDLSEELSGFPATHSTIDAFTSNPDLQLTHWPDDNETVGAHYGASYLMMHYFYHRFGPSALRDLSSEEANGAAGFDAVLARAGAGLDFDELFGDWVVANGVDDPAWDDGRYGYAQLDVQARTEGVIDRYPYSYQGDVAQYGSDYFELAPGVGQARNLELYLSGDAQVKLVPNDPASGRYQWWSNRGDSGHSSLERAVDLRDVQGATLSYNLWYDIERGWDYAYVRISEDEGRTWQLLRSRQMTDYNPIGNALGPGYTGKSGRGEGEEGEALWVRDEIDLSPYGGKSVLLSFDYITDDAVNRPGLCLDDFEVQGIGWRDDVESSEEGWRAEGFIRHDNGLPQRFVVQLIEFVPEPILTRHIVEPGGEIQWAIDGPSGRVDRALLIVSAMAPATTERAGYQFQIK
jgi:immune inhibitor A